MRLIAEGSRGREVFGPLPFWLLVGETFQTLPAPVHRHPAVEAARLTTRLAQQEQRTSPSPGAMRRCWRRYAAVPRAGSAVACS